MQVNILSQSWFHPALGATCSDADLGCFPRKEKQVTGSWSMCSKICKKLANIFQHWDNPGFIQDWEQLVQDADFEEKPKLHDLG